jgi:hypothetical protein
LKLNAVGSIIHTSAIRIEKDIPSIKYPLIDSIITCGVTVLARAICRMNRITIKSKKAIFAIEERVLSSDRFNNSDSHSIMTTAIAILKTFERSLLRESAESKKTNVKQRLYKIRCHSIGKKGIKKIVKTTSNNKSELLAVKNLLETLESMLIY